MTDKPPYIVFTDSFETLGLRYFVTGSVAATIYGEPRFTQDIDVVLELRTDSEIEALVHAFPEDHFYCAPAESLRIERRRDNRGHFNIMAFDSGFRADVYLAGKDPYLNQALNQRRKSAIAGHEMWIAPPEYVIVQKLRYYQEGHSQKHIDDIEGILGVSKDSIDFEALESTIQELGLTDLVRLIGSWPDKEGT